MRLAAIPLVPLLLATAASSTFLRGSGLQIGPYDEDEDEDALALGTNGTNGWGTFDQLIDHSNPGLGTFSQRYWYGTQHWKGPGSPIFLVNLGEQSGEGFNVSYLSGKRLSGLFAQELGGAVVLIEHRYWGNSSPFDTLTTENLQYLTLENSIKDNAYFARNFDAPFDKSNKSRPDQSPWVYMGGSYPGALANWIATLDPGTFWAYHGTSAVVQAIGDFWQYFEPVREATPQNCTKDLTAAIGHIDHVLLNGSEPEKKKLKDKFLLGDLEDADFASALENGPWTWQSTQFFDASVQGYNSYYQFCDYIENVWPNSTNQTNKLLPGPEGVGKDKALDGYAKWIKEILLPGQCESAGYPEWQGKYNTGCFANLNASNPAYKDLSLGNWANRQWSWMICNEPLEYWQDGAPNGQPTFVSRLVDREYWAETCKLLFPEGGYGLDNGKTAEDVNKYTGGWDNTNSTRLLYANGQLDPWRDSTVSSKFRPGGPLESTSELPVFLIPGGTHCSDFYGQNWDVNPELKEIVDSEISTLKTWLGEFHGQKEATS